MLLLRLRGTSLVRVGHVSVKDSSPFVRYHRQGCFFTSSRIGSLRFKGGGGASGGGGGGGGTHGSRTFLPPIGMRLCNVCGLENAAFCVPIAQGVSECEQRGLWCTRALGYEKRNFAVMGLLLALYLGYTLYFAEPEPGGSRSFKVAEEVKEIEGNGELARKRHLEVVLSAEKKRTPVNLVSAHGLTEVWTGTYTERGHTGHVKYTLVFDEPTLDDASNIYVGTFSGSGSDNDGSFEIRDAVYSPETGRFAWGEHSVSSSLIASCEAKCKDESCSRIKGIYRASTGLGGMMSLSRNVSGMKGGDVSIEKEGESIFSEEDMKQPGTLPRGRFAKWMNGEEDQDATATIDKTATNDPETANSLTTGVDEDDEVWVQAYDSESLSYYYWNPETGEAAWKKPGE